MQHKAPRGRFAVVGLGTTALVFSALSMSLTTSAQAAAPAGSLTSLDISARADGDANTSVIATLTGIEPTKNYKLGFSTAGGSCDAQLAGNLPNAVPGSDLGGPRTVTAPTGTGTYKLCLFGQDDQSSSTYHALPAAGLTFTVVGTAPTGALSALSVSSRYVGDGNGTVTATTTGPLASAVNYKMGFSAAGGQCNDATAATLTAKTGADWIASPSLTAPNSPGTYKACLFGEVSGSYVRMGTAQTFNVTATATSPVGTIIGISPSSRVSGDNNTVITPTLSGIVGATNYKLGISSVGGSCNSATAGTLTATAGSGLPATLNAPNLPGVYKVCLFGQDTGTPANYNNLGIDQTFTVSSAPGSGPVTTPTPSSTSTTSPSTTPTSAPTVTTTTPLSSPQLNSPIINNVLGTVSNAININAADAAGRPVNIEARAVIGYDAAGIKWGPWTTVVKNDADGKFSVKTLGGVTYEFRVQAVNANGTLTAWSKPAGNTLPMDAQPGYGSVTGPWVASKDAAAFGGTLWTTSAKGATYTSKVASAGSIGIAVKAQPGGGKMAVFVNGKRYATLSAASATVMNRQVVTTIMVPRGSQVVKLVHEGGGAVSLDGILFRV